MEYLVLEIKSYIWMRVRRRRRGIAMKEIFLAESLGIRLYLFRKLRCEELFDAGHQFGGCLTYAVQPSPNGLVQAFLGRGGI